MSLDRFLKPRKKPKSKKQPQQPKVAPTPDPLFAFHQPGEGEAEGLPSELIAAFEQRFQGLQQEYEMAAKQQERLRQARQEIRRAPSKAALDGLARKHRLSRRGARSKESVRAALLQTTKEELYESQEAMTQLESQLAALSTGAYVQSLRLAIERAKEIRLLKWVAWRHLRAFAARWVYGRWRAELMVAPDQYVLEHVRTLWERVYQQAMDGLQFLQAEIRTLEDALPINNLPSEVVNWLEKLIHVACLDELGGLITPDYSAYSTRGTRKRRESPAFTEVRVEDVFRQVVREVNEIQAQRNAAIAGKRYYSGHATGYDLTTVLRRQGRKFAEEAQETAIATFWLLHEPRAHDQWLISRRRFQQRQAGQGMTFAKLSNGQVAWLRLEDSGKQTPQILADPQDLAHHEEQYLAQPGCDYRATIDGDHNRLVIFLEFCQGGLVHHLLKAEEAGEQLSYLSLDQTKCLIKMEGLLPGDDVEVGALQEDANGLLWLGQMGYCKGDLQFMAALLGTTVKARQLVTGAVLLHSPETTWRAVLPPRDQKDLCKAVPLTVGQAQKAWGARRDITYYC